MTQVNWESVLGQLNEEFIEEALLSCEQPVSAAPHDEKETNMNHKVKKTSKRLLTVAVAAAMVMALAVVGFATDALPSLIGRLGSGHFADINPERDAFYQMAGEMADKNAETVNPETEQAISLTKEEAYYDGEKLVLAYTLNTEASVIDFDFGPEHEYFGELFTPPENNQKDLHQVVMVEAVDLDEEIVLSGDEMAFDNFRNVLERFDYLRVFVCLRKRHAYECANIKAECLWLYEETGSCDDSVCLQPFHSLVDRSSRNTALACNLEKWHSCVLYKKRKNLLVNLVDLIVCHDSYNL